MDNKAREEILRLMKETGITQTQLAKLLGMKNQSNVSEALKRDLKYSLFESMVDALGYEIIIQKKRRGRRSVDAE
jgi:transcriptional regulator with XRE-family HTH domain